MIKLSQEKLQHHPQLMRLIECQARDEIANDQNNALLDNMYDCINRLNLNDSRLYDATCNNAEDDKGDVVSCFTVLALANQPEKIIAVAERYRESFNKRYCTTMVSQGAVSQCVIDEIQDELKRKNSPHQIVANYDRLFLQATCDEGCEIGAMPQEVLKTIVGFSSGCDTPMEKLTWLASQYFNRPQKLSISKMTRFNLLSNNGTEANKREIGSDKPVTAGKIMSK